VANWLSQVSFEPRLIALGLQKKSHSHSLIQNGRVFTVNLFRKEDQDYMMPFTKSRAKNPEKMKDARYSRSPETGCPVLEGAAAYIECRVHDLIDIGGDHDIVVAEPIAAKILKEAELAEIMTLPDLGWSYAG
jgi:flavin reductase (DIM6/NTAB) family NADH-FMN oxidoreductase RutF